MYSNTRNTTSSSRTTLWSLPNAYREMRYKNSFFFTFMLW
jgi:hypothetical protein